MDAHLVAVPSLGTLTARGLTGGDLEGLGRQTDGALDTQVLALGALEDLGADLLEDVDLAGGEGDSDLVGLLFEGKRRYSQLFCLILKFQSNRKLGNRSQSTFKLRECH